MGEKYLSILKIGETMPEFEELWFNRRDALQIEASDIEGKALRRAGWHYTSQTPCCVWMWQKEIGGKLYSVSADDAASIQERADREAYFKQFPEELGD